MNKRLHFYHTDHSGSSNWVTHTDGYPVSYNMYLPFGESFLEITDFGTGMDKPDPIFTFSGKEKDWENYEKSVHQYGIGSVDLNVPLINRIARGMQETRYNMRMR